MLEGVSHYCLSIGRCLSEQISILMECVRYVCACISYVLQKVLLKFLTFLGQQGSGGTFIYCFLTLVFYFSLPLRDIIIIIVLALLTIVKHFNNRKAVGHTAMTLIRKKVALLNGKLSHKHGYQKIVK